MLWRTRPCPVVRVVWTRYRLDHRIGGLPGPHDPSATERDRVVSARSLAGGAGYGVKVLLPPLHPLFAAAVVVPVFGAVYFAVLLG